MNRSINVMVNKLCSILGDNIISIYLYGSVVMSDFKLGWSDIDILCLTKRVLSEPEAERLVNLRQDLLAEDAGNQYCRSFEGAILSFDEFREKEYERVVYWGTSGQRITDNYGFDAFSLFELIKYGNLIYGAEIREQLKLPTREELLDNVQRHYQTIRKYATKTDDTIYSCGWLLDIARCIYTLRYNDIISKTKAGEWALEENLCPDRECMLRTLQIRKNPLKYKEDEEVKKWLCSLGESVQLFADVLEEEMQRTEHYKYFMWDEKTFTLPKEFVLSENSDLADALNVFFMAGGYDFFNVVNPKYYSDKWLEFVGNLYGEIVGGKYSTSNKGYCIPLTEEQKKGLTKRGVPEVFVTDLKC